MDDFIKTLTTKERQMVESKFDLWFLPLETIRTFSVFLSNNNINLNL